MTFEIACSKCGSVLYSGFDLKSPGDLIKQGGGKCKECGVALLADRFAIEVQKFAGAFVPRHLEGREIGIPLSVQPRPRRPHLKNEALA